MKRDNSETTKKPTWHEVKGEEIDFVVPADDFYADLYSDPKRRKAALGHYFATSTLLRCGFHKWIIAGRC